MLLSGKKGSIILLMSGFLKAECLINCIDITVLVLFATDEKRLLLHRVSCISCSCYS